jgi:hypothetical protein
MTGVALARILLEYGDDAFLLAIFVAFFSLSTAGTGFLACIVTNNTTVASNETVVSIEPVEAPMDVEMGVLG